MPQSEPWLCASSNLFFPNIFYLNYVAEALALTHEKDTEIHCEIQTEYVCVCVYICVCEPKHVLASIYFSFDGNLLSFMARPIENF